MNAEQHREWLASLNQKKQEQLTRWMVVRVYPDGELLDCFQGKTEERGRELLTEARRNQQSAEFHLVREEVTRTLVDA